MRDVDLKQEARGQSLRAECLSMNIMPTGHVINHFAKWLKEVQLLMLCYIYSVEEYSTVYFAPSLSPAQCNLASVLTQL